jgi:spore coat protein U-like protein
MRKRCGVARRRRLARDSAVVAWALACAAVGHSSGAAAAADCTASATGVAFAIYDPSATAPNDSTGTVAVSCSYTGGGATQVAYSVRLSTGGSGSYAPRRMSAGANQLNYDLYSDAGHTLVWGNGLGGTTFMSGSFTVGPGVGNGLRQDSRTVYGRMPALQDALDGTYADTIVVTLEF